VVVVVSLFFSYVTSATLLLVDRNDLEYEMDRFSGPLAEATKKYTYMERPVGRPGDVVNVAVDALARLCLGLPDGEEIDPEDGELLVGVVSGALQQYWLSSSTPGSTKGVGDLEDQVRRAVSTRTARKDAYV